MKAREAGKLTIRCVRRRFGEGMEYAAVDARHASLVPEGLSKVRRITGGHGADFVIGLDSEILSEALGACSRTKVITEEHHDSLCDGDVKVLLFNRRFCSCRTVRRSS